MNCDGICPPYRSTPFFPPLNLLIIDVQEPVYSVGPGEYFPTYLIDDVEHLRWTASVATTAPSKIIVVEQTAVAVVDPDLWKRCQDDPLAISTVRKFTEKVEELRAGGREVQFVPKTKPRAIWDPEPV